jgi:hypothetical protein
MAVMADEVVSVALWRGYVTGCFYARPADRDVAVAQSPTFRISRWPWQRPTSVERDQTAAGALDALQKALVDAGWQRMSGGAGARWYQLSFRKPVRDGLLTPRPREVDVARLHVAEPVREAPAEVPDHVEATVAEPANGHTSAQVAEEIVAALQAGPLASHELCSRVGRHSGIVRIARRELEHAGLVRRAPTPAGRSKRAIYWQLSR